MFFLTFKHILLTIFFMIYVTNLSYAKEIDLSVYYQCDTTFRPKGCISPNKSPDLKQRLKEHLGVELNLKLKPIKARTIIISTNGSKRHSETYADEKVLDQEKPYVPQNTQPKAQPQGQAGYIGQPLTGLQAASVAANTAAGLARGQAGGAVGGVANNGSLKNGLLYSDPETPDDDSSIKAADRKPIGSNLRRSASADKPNSAVSLNKANSAGGGQAVSGAAASGSSGASGRRVGGGSGSSAPPSKAKPSFFSDPLKAMTRLMSSGGFFGSLGGGSQGSSQLQKGQLKGSRTAARKLASANQPLDDPAAVLQKQLLKQQQRFLSNQPTFANTQNIFNFLCLQYDNYANYNRIPVDVSPCPNQ